ncbi:N-acetylmuramoyl-L-alanine amidase [Streptosporangiaceae bacterium NEAU-GS5]|nr:N-acetylmuramoyl-L-alanine amidase [Streptosporangiaceae bacterium NEAU-GS5]
MVKTPARWFTPGRRTPIRVIVIHDMEAPGKSTTAEAVARYFAFTDNKVSAHVCVDDDSAVHCVADHDTAWAAPGANGDGLQLEIAGHARRTREEWLNGLSRAALVRAAEVVAQWCHAYAIPVMHLSVDQLKSGARGIVGHADVSAAYRRGDHTDPGGHFPWEEFLEMVQAAAKADR